MPTLVRRCGRLILAFSAPFLLAGCVMSSTIGLAPEHPKPMFGRAVIVFSVSVEAPWPYHGFEVQLDKYDLAKQDTAGGCFRFERVSGAVTPPVVGTRKYFAFLAPPGASAYSSFNAAPLEGASRAFIAPSGQVTYVGDFAFKETRSAVRGYVGGETHNQFVSLADNIHEAEEVTGVKLVPAQVVQVAPAHIFLCTP